MKKFFMGERVKLNGFLGNIWDYKYENNSIYYKIKFDDKDRLIGADDWYREIDIEYAEERCPVCNSKWDISKSPVLDTYWYDCPICKKTKETITKEVKNNPPKPADSDIFWTP